MHENTEASKALGLSLRQPWSDAKRENQESKISERPSNVATLTSRMKIRRAVKHLQKMPPEKRIDLMVEAKLITNEQPERARKKLAETPREEEDPVGPIR